MMLPGMPTDPSCMDDFDPTSLSVDTALDRILSAVTPVDEFESVPLRDGLGRVLAHDVMAVQAVPPAANSAMDGYAIAGADIPARGTRDLVVIGTASAGHPHVGRVGPGEAVRIMTGAVLPPGADTVLMQERVTRLGEHVRIGADARPGDHVRAAGEDIAPGSRLLQRGTWLTPADIGLLASQGMAHMEVRRRPRVALFSTGDELRSLDEPLGPGDVHDSNRHTLFAMLARLGASITDLGVVRDDRAALEHAILVAAGGSDVVITTGGVSVGEADFVRDILGRAGTVDFWKVAMKPGRPLAFGRVQEAWFFGLPGNPVSVMVTFYQFVMPALRRIMGQRREPPLRFRVRCDSRLKKRPGRVEFQRGILSIDHDGTPVVRVTGNQGSGILSSMAQANCFIVLSMESTGAEPGHLVDVEPFFGLI